MDGALLEQRAPGPRAGAGHERIAVHLGHDRGVGRIAVRNRGHEAAVRIRPQDHAVHGVAQPRRVVDQDLQDRIEIERGAADRLEHLGGRGLLPEGFVDLPRAVLDFLLQPRVRLAQLRGHAVELVGQRLEFVAGPDVDFLVELALADLLRAFLQRADRPHHAAREPPGSQRREQQAGDDEHARAHDGRIERGVNLRHRLLDEHLPAQRLDARESGQDLFAGEVAREARRFLRRRPARPAPP